MRAPSPTRRRRPALGLAASAVAVAALVGGCGMATSALGSVDGAAAPAVKAAGVAEAAGSLPEAMAPDAATPVAGPQIVRTGAVSLESDDVTGATRQVLALVTADRGTVSQQNTSTDRDGQASSSITAQVPATSLDSFLDQVARLGTVRSVSTSAQDVTSQAVDLDARIAALQSSIARLKQLMAQAGSVSDLLAAEEQLSSRQADLDSLTAQRTWLSTQVAMSTVTVQIDSPQDSGSTLALTLAGIVVVIVLVGGAGVVVGVLVTRRRRTSPDPS